VLLRLPLEVRAVPRLADTHHPDRAAHVMSTIQQLRGGKDYDSQFGTRMRGQGVYADLLNNRFKLARKRWASMRRTAIGRSWIAAGSRSRCRRRRIRRSSLF
jgi:DNA repair photolyase